MKINQLLKILENFSKSSSVVGYEKEFINFLNNRFKKLDIETEVIENDLLIIKSSDKKYSDYYTCCHIDREGLVLNKGKLFYATQFLDNKFSEKECEKIGKRFIDKKIKIDDNLNIITDYKVIKKNDIVELLFFTNKKNKSNVNSIPISCSEDIKFNEDNIIGQLDNVINVAILYILIKENKIKGNVIFSTREEVGLSGKMIVDYLQNKKANENLLILDTTPFDEKDYIKGEVSLRHRDSNYFYSEDKTLLLESICESLKIPYRHKDKIIEEKGVIKTREDGSIFGYGLTELGSMIHESNGNYNGITFQLPVIDYGLDERVYISNLENYMSVLEEYYKKL